MKLKQSNRTCKTCRTFEYVLDAVWLKYMLCKMQISIKMQVQQIRICDGADW